MQPINGQMLPEIGYHLHKKHWRKGYGSEAASAVRDWFFTHTGHDYVYSYMNDTNVASYATAAKIGMRKIKEYTDETGELLYVYALTRDEWKKKTK
jgi:RimJ/RimL family protein N-acetyltransferase